MDLVQLLNDLIKAFDESELNEFCFKLGINYEDLGGKGRRGNARELIEYVKRRQQLPQLVQALVKERPLLAEKYAVYLQQSEDLQPETEAPQAPAAATIDPTPSAQPSPTNSDAIPTSTPVNPYNAGPMITNKEMFFGRQSELRRLRSRLLNMGSSSIVGMRRIGKSSLLYYLSHHESLPSDQRFLFAYLDLQDGRFHTLEGLLSNALQSWYGQINQTRHPAPPTLATFSQEVRSLRANGYRPVLCLDEFDNLTRRPEEFSNDVFETWRALGNERQLTFLTVSHRPLANLIESGGLTSSFHNIFNQIDLGLLDKTSARDLLTKPFKRQQILQPPSIAVDELLVYCGYHPFYLQMAAFYLCDVLLSNAYDLGRVKEDFIWEADRHWNGLWQAFSQEEKSVFPLQWKLATTDNEKQQYRNLERKGFIFQEEGAYKPFSQGFVEWILALPADEKPEAPLQTTNPTPPPKIKDDSPSNTPEMEGIKPPSGEVNIKLLLVATGVTLIILVVTAWVLASLLEIKSVGSLLLVLAVAFPFVLVLVGKLAGQDFIGWLGNLLGKK